MVLIVEAVTRGAVMFTQGFSSIVLSISLLLAGVSGVSCTSTPHRSQSPAILLEDQDHFGQLDTDFDSYEFLKNPKSGTAKAAPGVKPQNSWGTTSAAPFAWPDATQKPAMRPATAGKKEMVKASSRKAPVKTARGN